MHIQEGVTQEGVATKLEHGYKFDNVGEDLGS